MLRKILLIMTLFTLSGCWDFEAITANFDMAVEDSPLKVRRVKGCLLGAGDQKQLCVQSETDVRFPIVYLNEETNRAEYYTVIMSRDPDQQGRADVGAAIFIALMLPPIMIQSAEAYYNQPQEFLTTTPSNNLKSSW